MGKYLIADLVIEIKNKYNYLAAQCAQYKCSEDAACRYFGAGYSRRN